MSIFDRVVGRWRRQEVLASGAAAPATVTAARSLGRTSAAGSLTELALEIDPPGGKPFRRTIREWVPPGWEGRLTAGTSVTVRYDDRTVVLDARAMGMVT
jgi:hypothetical protein